VYVLLLCGVETTLSLQLFFGIFIYLWIKSLKYLVK